MANRLKGSGAARMLLTSGIAAGALAACGGGPNLAVPDVICPGTGIVEETNTLTRFRDSGDHGQDDVVYTAHISDLAVACRLDDGVVTDIGFSVTARGGPALDSDQISVPYFVAVVSGNGGIVAKDVYMAVFDMSGDAPAATVRESIRQHLAVEDTREAQSFEILIGLQLSEDEFIYNLSQ